MQLRALLVVASFLSLVASADAGDEEAIRKVFDAYKVALLNRDGREAVRLVDRKTVGYFGEVRRLALQADAGEIKARPFIDRLMVVRVRHQVGVEMLREVGPEDLIRLGVERGWVGDESIREQALGDVRISGDSATGQLVLRGRPAPARHRFRKEDDRWKINLTEIMGLANAAMKALARQNEMEEDEFIVEVVGQLSGEEVPPGIWDKPKATGDEKPKERDKNR